MSYTVVVDDASQYEIGQQPGGWWVVAINLARNEISWAFDWQVHR